uniref:CCHC-type domain-containing protein n=1 Tax=Gopherus evgoodei TaxID=1825980 RepID=A0A8C4WP03_9SAUR
MARTPGQRQDRPPVKKPCPPAVIPTAPDPMPPPPVYPGLPASPAQPPPSVVVTPESSPPPPENGSPLHESTTPDTEDSSGEDYRSQETDTPATYSGNTPIAHNTRLQKQRQCTKFEGGWQVASAPGNTKIVITKSPEVKKTPAATSPVRELPLRETVGPEGGLTMIYVPFTTSDLYNWKHQNPSFSEDPAPLTAVFETLVSAHNPTWGDMRIALNTLLTAEERRLVFSKAKEALVAGGVDAADIPDQLPEAVPNWPHTSDAGRDLHRKYARAIVQGMKRCIRKTPNWAKLYNIRQEKNENPAAFYERLCNTCKRYTDLDPEDVNGKRVLIPLFIGQSYEDIRKKLQKIEGASGKNIEELLEIALKVYDRRDDEERKKGARLLAMALKGETGKGGSSAKGRTGSQEKGRGTRLGRNQCAICKEEGHWKNECPRRHDRREGSRNRIPPVPVFYNEAHDESVV